MGSFDKIQFHGNFRDYQSRVLDRTDSYLKDGKIHIVAAPGSGKTVLGLELIRKLGKPCLIFSPTTAIREQWGERLKALFLEDPASFDTVFSSNLRSIKLINSITYQALYSAMEHISDVEEEDDAYPEIDIVEEIKKNNIGTICLDEAHHLKNEWQKALEKLIALVDKQVTVISLTATPPYDAEGTEWNRYITMCGEVDEEIFVPELVAQNTLCPHQDYIYFNYPTSEECAVLDIYRKNVTAAIEELGTMDVLKTLCYEIQQSREYDRLYSSAKEYIALLVLFRHYGFPVNTKIIQLLTGAKDLPAQTPESAQTAVSFLLEGDLLKDTEKEQLIVLLKKHSVYHKKKVEFLLTEKLKRMLLSSTGKLESIAKIAQSEYDALGQTLRMLILTDYIKKEEIGQIVSRDSFSSVSVVSIFEMLRRTNDQINIGVLSGSLIILPDSVPFPMPKHTRRPIAGTRYSVIDCSASTHMAVKAVGSLFEKGELQILVGTKSLLGEGWDAPWINSLILASFVGSFVLSNQMRGRAIRVDKADPHKTANIWHLVTVEPEFLFTDSSIERIKQTFLQDKNKLSSYDFELLKRRFDAFMGPNYSSGVIESGIERITAIMPPYDKAGIEKINSQMLSLSRRRQDLFEKWQNQVHSGNFRVAKESMVPNEKRVPITPFFHAVTLLLLSILEISCIRTWFLSVTAGPPSFGFDFIFSILLTACICYIGFHIGKKMILHFSPAHSVKTLGHCIYAVLRECGILSSCARVEVKEEKAQGYLCLSLANASMHDQNVFNTAMAELLSPIENPRYLLIPKHPLTKYRYSYAFACPTVIGKKKEYVSLLAKKLKETTAVFEPVYTRTEDGRKLILQCRKKSFITHNEKMINQKYKVTRWE